MQLIVKITLLFLIYFMTARVGLSLGAVNDFATPVWPPSGISLAALLLFGYKLWPGIFLGAFLINFLTGAPVPVSFGIAIGNTLEALAGTFILNHLGFRTALERLKDSMILIFGAAILATLISSVIGTFSLYTGGLISSGEIRETWFAWWVGDMLGNLVVTPLILAWYNRPKYQESLTHSLEVILSFLSLLLASSIIFEGFLGINTASLPIIYIVIPPLIWISVRFSPRALTTAIFLLSAVAISATVLGYGIFANPNLSHGLLVLQGFLGVHAATFLILSSTINERKDLERKKDEFIGVASHEFKTPITTLKAYIQLMEKLPPSSGQLGEYFQRANREVDRLTKLVGDLLDFNRVRSDKMQLELEHFFIDELIAAIVQDLQVANPKRKIIYQSHLRGQLKILADKYRIEQVISNLLLNALKFSPNGKKVYIRLYKSRGHIQVSVRDSGIGISPKFHQDIFTKFFQAKEKSKEVYPGLGLGLYICAQIIKMHRGEIWVESQRGKGSTFFFKIPVK